MADFKGKTIINLEILNAEEKSIRDIQKLSDNLQLTSYDQSNGLIKVALEFPNSADLRQQIFEYAVNEKWVLLEMSRHKASLEDVFRDLTIEGGSANE